MPRRSAFTSIVDDSDDNEDIDKITAYCESCASFDFYYKLGPRIYKGPKPYYSDNWLQCYNCGEITPRVMAKQQNIIAPIVEPPDNIHDSNKAVVLSAKSVAHRSRAIIKSIQELRPGYRRRKMIEEDSHIQRMIKAGKQLVSYSEKRSQK
jgi:ribosomal protein S26